MSNFQIKVDGLAATKRALSALPAAVSGRIAKRAIAKGTVLIRDQARANLKAAIALPGKTGITKSSGFTEKNVIGYIASTAPGWASVRGVVTVLGRVHPNMHKFRKGSLQANDIAFMMEYGTSKQSATPWFRTAFLAREGDARRVIEAELVRGIVRAGEELSKG